MIKNLFIETSLVEGGCFPYWSWQVQAKGQGNSGSHRCRQAQMQFSSAFFPQNIEILWQKEALRL